MNKKNLDLDIDMKNIKNHDDYKKVWNQLGKIETTMVERNEECKHCIGDKFIFKNPYDKPNGLCTALLHVMEL
jgi:hypothetical protein